MKDRYFLSKGAHDTATDGRCAMEWVAYLAGERHSDSPECVSPVLTTFCIPFNDVLDDERRQRLRPFLARTIGTRGDGLDERRAWLCTDWLVRTYAPTWLSLAGLGEHAERLRALPPVLAVENAERAVGELTAAWDAAWAAARTAARAAARTAAWDAAWAAARTAARTAARAAARDAARAAARTAAWDAARTAAGDALQPTVITLQESAFGLLDRMLPTEIIRLPVAADYEQVCALV